MVNTDEAIRPQSFMPVRTLHVLQLNTTFEDPYSLQLITLPFINEPKDCKLKVQLTR